MSGLQSLEVWIKINYPLSSRGKDSQVKKARHKRIQCFTWGHISAHREKRSCCWAGLSRNLKCKGGNLVWNLSLSKICSCGSAEAVLRKVISKMWPWASWYLQSWEPRSPHGVKWDVSSLWGFSRCVGSHLATLWGLLPSVPPSPWSGTCVIPCERTKELGMPGAKQVGTVTAAPVWAQEPPPQLTGFFCLCVFLSCRKASPWLLLLIRRRGLWLDSRHPCIPSFSMADRKPGAEAFPFHRRCVRGNSECRAQTAESRNDTHVVRRGKETQGNFSCVLTYSASSEADPSFPLSNAIFPLWVLWVKGCPAPFLSSGYKVVPQSPPLTPDTDLDPF